MQNRDFFIETTLDGIRDISDLNHEIIEKLQSLPSPKITIKTLTVSPSDMAKWEAENGLPDGFEYDIATNRIAIKVQEHAVHKAIRMLFQDEIFPAMIGKLSQQLPEEVFTTNSNKSLTLSQGGYAGDIVAADCQLDQDISDAPRIVLLFGTEYDVFRGAKKWIRGTGGATETVIGIEVASQPSASQCPWGLTKEEIINMDLKDLTSYVQKWHEEKEIPIFNAVETALFIITKEELAASAPLVDYTWSAYFNSVPGGISPSRRVTRIKGIKLHGNVVFDLPFREITVKVSGALPEFEKERALLMATEAQNWAVMTKDSSTLVPPFPV